MATYSNLNQDDHLCSFLTDAAATEIDPKWLFFFCDTDFQSRLFPLSRTGNGVTEEDAKKGDTDDGIVSI